MRRCRAVFRNLLLLTLLVPMLVAPAFASHETIVIDGDLTDLINAVNNNLGGSDGGFAAPNALGNIYSTSCSFVNGFDMRNNYALFDFKNANGDFTPNDVTLYLGWEVEGVIGDVDGDGSPNTYTNSANFACANNGDQAGIGQFEAYKTFLDLDCDLSPDVVFCVQNNQVIMEPNTPIPGAEFSFNGSFLEVKIPNAQNFLPAGTNFCEANLFQTANSQFDGLGEDFSPSFQLRVDPLIELTKTPAVQDACAGQDVSWTIKVKNTGLCTLEQLVVTDTLSTGMTFVSSNPASTGDAQNRSWMFTNVAPGDSIEISLTANITAPCAVETHKNSVTAEGVHVSGCTKGSGVRASTMASVNCRNTPCDVTGDLNVCVGNTKTYTTTVAEPFLRTWSVTSTPGGICNIVGATDGPSVQVNFTGAGACTVSLLVQDPLDPDACQVSCQQIVTVNPQPPCNITGDLSVCVGNAKTYTTTAGAEYTRAWSVTSTPGGICAIDGPTDGGSINVNFTGAGACTVSLTVTDPNDPTDCTTTCTEIITVNPQPPCNITGDLSVCVGNAKTYTTTAGAEYTRAWSVTSTPGGICAIDGPTDGGSINVNFTGAGACTVSLTVTDPNDPTDCTTTCTEIITVNPQPPCNITGDLSVCVGNTKTYTTTAGAEYTRAWSVTSTPGGICAIDGPTDGGSINVNFTGAGACTVSLTVTDPNDPTDCTTTCTEIITVNPQPPCNITGDLSVCVGNAKTYTTTVGAEYTRAWSVTSTPGGICAIDGPTDGGSINVNFTGAGACTVSLTVTDPNDPTDCTTTCTEIVTVNPQPPCNIDGDLSVCVGNTKTYTTAAGAEYTRAWSVTSTPGGICAIDGPTDGGSINVNFTGAGACTVSLTVTDPNDPTDCTTTCTEIVTVNPQPPCNITGDLSVCVGNTKTYTTTAGAEYTRAWSVTSTPGGICAIDGPTDGGSINVNFTGAGACTVSLTVTDPNDPTDCTTTCTEIVTVNPQPPCNITGDLSVCVGNTKTYSTTVNDPVLGRPNLSPNNKQSIALGGNYLLSWSVTSTPGGICTIAGPTDQSSVQVNFTGAGACTVSLTVTDPNDPTDCTTTCTEIITVNPQPPCNITGDLSVCVGNSKTYSTTAGAEYTRAWSVTSTPGGICAIDGPTDGGSINVNFTGAGACTVSLTVTDPNDPTDCTTTCTEIVTVNPQPPCNITGDLSVCVGNTKTYSTTAGAEYTRAWSVTSTPGGICAIDGATDGGSINVNFTGAGACTVSLTVTDPNDPTDCTTTCTEIVTVNPQPPCNITGDLAACVGNTKTYTTTAGAEYTRAWSVTSTPGGICAIDGPTDGGSINVNFTGAGACTVSLTVTDPNDPTDCTTTCTEIITVSPQPPCDITGDLSVCVGNTKTYSTTAGAEYTRAWSVTSTPGGICAIDGATDGGSINVNFTGAGACTVSLTVTDPNDPTDCTTTCTEIITVNPQPPCDITGDLSVCVGNTKTYSTTAGAEYTRAWSVTSTPGGICAIDGPTDGGSINVNFTGAGACTVSLTVSDPNDPTDCTTTCTEIITVNPQPPCNITGDLAACVGNTKTYTTTAGAEYTRAWSVTSTPGGICAIDGPTDGGSINVNFTGAGACTVSLTVTDPNDPTDCTTTCTAIVNVAPLPPCSVEGDQNVCVGNSKIYSTNVGAGYNKQWTFSSTPGGICSVVGAADGDQVQVDFTGAGQCTLSLTISDVNDPENCRNSCTYIIDVNPQPPCNITGDLSVCVGNTKTYTTAAGAEYTRAWSVTSTPGGICAIDGPTDGGSINVNFTGAGACTVSLTVTDPNDPTDCTTTCTEIITVNPQPPCNITGDLSVCVGNTKTYTTTAGAEYTRAWSVTSTPGGICAIDGPTDGGSINVNFTGAGACTVSLTVTDPNDPTDCTTTCTEIVNVNNQPPCNITGDLSVCVGNTKSYTTTAGAEYTRTWSVTSNPGGICSIVGGNTGGSISVNFTGAGACTVSLTVTDPNDPTDCTTTCTQIVNVIPQPPCDIDGDLSVCVGNTKSYTTTVGAEYTRTWSVTSNPGGICSIVGGNTGGSISVNFTGAGACTVSLTVTDPNGPADCTTTCTEIVNVSNQPPCNIAGDRSACVGNTKSYTTTAGAQYTRTWSVTSNPGGICSIVGGNTGGSISVNFTGAGACTVSLTVTDPNDPTDCTTTCQQIVTVNAVPTCTIAGPDSLCGGASDLTYTVTSDPAGASFSWQISGDGTIVGSTSGSSVTVNAGDAGGSFTLTVTVSNGDCSSTCSLTRDLEDCTPNNCWMTGGGFLNEGSRSGQKNHTFGGNVGPPPSGSWEHIVRKGNKIEFNFHSWDSQVDSCWADDGAGPCSPHTDIQNIIWSGTGKYSMGNGSREYDGTFTAYVQDRKEGSCGTKDYYEITVYDLGGGVVFHAGQPIDGGNLQLHKPTGSTTKTSFELLEPSIVNPPVPNPFRTSTTITYYVDGESSLPVTVSVYDVTGRLIRKVADEFRYPGEYEAVWDGRSEEGETVASGIYFVRVVAGTRQSITRVMFTK